MSGSSADTGSRLHASADLDEAIAYRLHRSNRLLLTHLARVLERRRAGLTAEKWFVLARLHSDGPMRQVDLTERALEDAPNVSRLVDGLVAAELVERRPDPDDRRAKLLELSADGRALADQLLDDVRRERERVFAGLDDADLGALTAALDRVDQNVRSLLER
ncbi:MAG: MarR family transcriptional regulator [Actinomycetota bacterium]